MTARRSNLYWQSPPSSASVLWCRNSTAPRPAARAHGIPRAEEPLTIDELEAGLRVLDRMDCDKAQFWNENGRAFQATIRLAIRETAEALLLQRMPQTLRDELEGQLAWLTSCLEPHDRH